jgi:hypothetical protein
MASQEPGGMLALPPFQGFIWGMSDQHSTERERSMQLLIAIIQQILLGLGDLYGPPKQY